MRRLVLPVFVTLTLLAAALPWAQAEQPAAPASEGKLNAEQVLVNEAEHLAAQGKPSEALQAIEKAMTGYEARYADLDKTIYSARTPSEALLYMLEAANANMDAIAVEFEYGYAWYLKGFVLIDLGRTDQALASLQKAVALSPSNSQFLSELGNLQKVAKDWPAALATFERAEDASGLSPDAIATKDLSRALRGQGFVLSELGRYDEAENIFKRCLELDPDDTMATNELIYIQQQRTGQVDK